MAATIIHFIINPISGKGSNQLNLELVSSVFNSEEFDIKTKETLEPGHAKRLAVKSVAEGADIVVACGGDGTVNEVASGLVGTDVGLGIVPMGSGNGLASTLKIPKNIVGALKLIKKFNTVRIDVGQINNEYFFSNTGIGFDAKVISYYSKTKGRGFASYLKAVFSTILYNTPSPHLVITTENKSFNLRPFLVFVSNSSEMGYEISLTPQASVQDGMLNAIVVEPLNKLEVLYFAFLLLTKKPQNFKKAHYFLTQNIEIKIVEKECLLNQIDGESTQIKTNQVKITLKKDALKALVP